MNNLKPRQEQIQLRLVSTLDEMVETANALGISDAELVAEVLNRLHTKCTGNKAVVRLNTESSIDPPPHGA